MTQRQQQAMETKEHIMSVALNLLKDYPYDKLSLHKICTEAKVSTGAFYHHFKGKQDLIVEGYKNCDEYFSEHILNELVGDTYTDRIKEYLICQMKYAQNVGIDIMIQLYKAQITEANDYFLQIERGLPDGLNKLICNAQKNNEIRNDISSEDITSELLLISRGIIYNWCQNKGEYNLEKKCESIISNHLEAFIIKK